MNEETRHRVLNGLRGLEELAKQGRYEEMKRKVAISAMALMNEVQELEERVTRIEFVLATEGKPGKR